MVELMRKSMKIKLWLHMPKLIHPLFHVSGSINCAIAYYEQQQNTVMYELQSDGRMCHSNGSTSVSPGMQ